MAADGLPQEVASLDDSQREVLAALAVMGESTLSAGQIGALLGTADVRPTLAELDRRGLLRRDGDRYGVAPGLKEKLAGAWNVVDTGDRVLRQLISIAADGRLTLGDLDAVLGISEWACEVGRFSELLQLVKTVQTAVDVYNRVEDWITIVRRARTAARELGDRGAERWAEDELRRAEQIRSQAPTRELPRAAERVGSLSTVRGLPWLGRVAALVVTAAAGIGIGFAWGGSGTSHAAAGGTTVTDPGSTVTLPGTVVTLSNRTVTLSGSTIRLPGTTVTASGSTTTVTSISTTTVTSTPSIK